MTGMGSFAGDFRSHIEMGSPKVYVRYMQGSQNALATGTITAYFKAFAACNLGNTNP